MALGFLIDENVPVDVIQVLREAGRAVREVRAALRRGAPDAEVIAAAVANNEIVVTWNRKHFNKGRSHVLAFNCPEPIGATRLRAAWEIVELEARLADERTHRFLVQLNQTAMVVGR